MTTYRELKIKEAGGLVSVGDPRTSEALVSTEARQFGAAGSVLDNVPMRVHPAEQLLKYSVLWLDAAHSSAGSQTITNLGWGGSALDARNGSTTGADSNDALFLDWTGENYVYLPGLASNSMSVPDSAPLDVTGDIDIRVQVAMGDWTPATDIALLYKMNEISGYALMLNTGRIRVYWRFGGGSLGAADSVALNLSAGALKWVRATIDIDNGASGRTITFYTSDDGVTWTALGSPVVQAGVTALIAGTQFVNLGDLVHGGKFYRAQVFNGIDGTKVLDVDTSVLTSGAATSFLALTGQTVTISRSTTGRKSVAVVSPVWLFGTDDYMEVADNDLIDFGAADSFTVLAVVRQWATTAAFTGYVSKFSGTNPGWLLGHPSASSLTYSYINGVTGSTPNASNGNLSTAVLKYDTSSLTTIINGVSGTPTPTSALDSRNSAAFRVGHLTSAGSGPIDMELLAVAVFRRALTATEITTLNSYYQSRIGG